MSKISKDFVYFPDSSPWLTPPQTPAETRFGPRGVDLNVSGVSGKVESEEIFGDKNLLRWVKENTRMNSKDIRCGYLDNYNDDGLLRLKRSHQVNIPTEIMKINANNYQQRGKTTANYIHLHHSHNNTTVDNDNNDNSKMILPEKPKHIYTDTDLIYRTNPSFYQLVCLEPTKNGKEESEDDDEDDFVLEFLEAYKKLLEINKFQAKVYLRLWKDSTSAAQPMFLCADDSKKFITLHDFSVYQFKHHNFSTCCNDNCNIESCLNPNPNDVGNCGNNKCNNKENVDNRGSTSTLNNIRNPIYCNDKTDCCNNHSAISFDISHPATTLNNNINKTIDPCGSCTDETLTRNDTVSRQLHSNNACGNKINGNNENNNNDRGNNYFSSNNIPSSLLYTTTTTSKTSDNICCCSNKINNNKGSLDKTTYAKTYAFDRIFTTEESMMDVYVESISAVLKAVIAGHNGCIVSYGEAHVSTLVNTEAQKYGGSVHYSLKWLYALLEENCLDSSTTFSLKMSASEFIGNRDLVHDLLAGSTTNGKHKSEIPAGFSMTESLKVVRVSNYQEALNIMKKSKLVKTDPYSHLLFTIHLRQYHAKSPTQRRIISFSNQLHIINLCDREKGKGMIKNFPPPSSSPTNTSEGSPVLTGRDNIIQYIGSLMAGQKVAPGNSNVRRLLQSCITPSTIQCQSCLILRLSQNTTNLRDMQKLLHLGTKIYKQRFRRTKQFKSGQSSTSETSSCASSGFSNCRKSRVKMGTRQWQKNASNNIVSTYQLDSNFYSDLQANFLNFDSIPSRPNHLDLQHVFTPEQYDSNQSSSYPLQTKVPPPPYPLRTHWKHFIGHGLTTTIQDTILESPEKEERWDRSTKALRCVEPNHFLKRTQETWVDGPASMVPSPYANIPNYNRDFDYKWVAESSKGDVLKPSLRSFHSNKCGYLRPFVNNSANCHADLVSTHSHHSFSENVPKTIQSQHSFTKLQVMTSTCSQSTNLVSRIHKMSPFGIQPMNSLEYSDRLARIPSENPTPNSETNSLAGKAESLGKKTFKQSSIGCGIQVKSVIGQKYYNEREESALFNQSSKILGIRKGSLPNDIPVQCRVGDEIKNGWKKMTDDCTLHNKLMTSSLYEKWFEDKLEEKESSNILTGSCNPNHSVFKTYHLNNTKPVDAGYVMSKVDFDLIQHNNSINNKKEEEIKALEANKNMASKKIGSQKLSKFEPFKKFRHFFSKGLFKSSTMSPSSLYCISNQQDRPIKSRGTSSPLSQPSNENSKKVGNKILNSSFEQGSKKRFNFFSRRTGSLKTDMIVTAPPTPSIYYDNHAASNTMASTTSASAFNFPTFKSDTEGLDRKRIGSSVGQKPSSTNSRWPSFEMGEAKEAVDIQANPLTRGGGRGLSLESGTDSCTSTPGHRRGGTLDFFAFVEEDEDDKSQVESSVANVVCYRKIPFAKKGTDQSKTLSNCLAPSYYRFSKLSSDGEFDKDYATLDNYCQDLNTNNNNNIKISVIKHTEDEDDDNYFKKNNVDCDEGSCSNTSSKDISKAVDDGVEEEEEDGDPRCREMIRQGSYVYLTTNMPTSPLVSKLVNYNVEFNNNNNMDTNRVAFTMVNNHIEIKNKVKFQNKDKRKATNPVRHCRMQ